MRVLLVEDEERLQRYLRQGLEEEGYAVDVVGDGELALAAARTTDYDALVLDLMLPLVDGLEVCRRLRRLGKNVPILMLTARDALDDRVRGLDAGADDYLVKPFAFEELLARLRSVTRRTLEVPRSSELAVADLKLNTLTKRVSRGPLSLDLPAKEYALLECLMRAPDRIFTRQQIVDRIWDSTSYTESNVVDVYIRNLRRKIDDPFPVKLIGTVRGLGYRISAQGGQDGA